MAEVDDTELANLKAAAKFIEEMEKQPDGRKTIQKFAKAINPKIRTEEDVAAEYAAPIIAKLEGLEKWKEGLETKISTYNDEQSWEEVKKTYGYTDEGIKTLREFSEKNGIKNPKHAAAVWEKENPPKPVTPAYQGTQFDLGSYTGGESEDSKKAELEKMNKNPQRYEDDQIRKFYEEKNQGKWNPSQA